MIKVIAFDLVGTILKENDYELTKQEQMIERMFGKNMNDDELIKDAMLVTGFDREKVVKSIKKIISRIYDVPVNLRPLKEKYKNVKFYVASNHLSYIKDFLDKEFNGIFDEVIISSLVDVYKPDKKFYDVLIKKADVLASEILFLDDRKENVEAAIKCGLKSELVTKCNVNEIINKYLNKAN